MSGGSYDYLCYKEVEELFRHEETLERMADRLAGLGYATDAAAETANLLLLIRQARIRLDSRVKRLADVWQAVEWWDSGDSGENGVKVALAGYREELEAPV